MPARSRSWRTKGLLCLGLVALSTAALAERPAVVVQAGAGHEVAWGERDPLPSLGPRYAKVTVDLFQPIVPGPSFSNVALVLRLAKTQSDLRVVFHPVQFYGGAGPGYSLRGAEVLREADLVGRFWPICKWLYQHPDLLAPEKESDLLGELGKLGMDGPELQKSLRTRRHKPWVDQILARERPLEVRTPEIWVNGTRLVGQGQQGEISEIALREAIFHQGERAQDLLDLGVPLQEVHPRLIEEERRDHRRSQIPHLRELLLGMEVVSKGTPKERPPLAGAPSRGPEVSPVLIVLYVNPEGSSLRSLPGLVVRAMERHPGSVRLVVKFMQSGQTSGRMIWLLSQLHEKSPGRFWQVLDTLILTATRGPIFTREFDRALAQAKVQVEGQAPPSFLGSLSAHSETVTLAAKPPQTSPLLERLRRDQQEASRLELSSPSLLLNGVIIRGSISEQAFFDLVRREKERGLIQRLLQR